MKATGFVDNLPVNGLELLAGNYDISIVRTGFISQILCVSVDQTDTRKSLFLTPTDTTIRALLRWGGAISELQLYVVPVGTSRYGVVGCVPLVYASMVLYLMCDVTVQCEPMQCPVLRCFKSASAYILLRDVQF